MTDVAAPLELGSPDFWARLAADPARLAAEIASVDVVNLDLTLERHAALRAWVNASHETARIGEERALYEVTKARARALLKAKETPDPHTEKSKTVQVLDAEVETNEAVLTAENTYLDAQEKRGVLRAMSNALEDRLQMLIQISAKRRAERRDPS